MAFDERSATMLKPGIKMLVADDASVVHDIFRQAVTNSGLSIETIDTSNGRECLGVLNQGAMDLAFIDVFMPGLSGVEALRQARSRGIKTFVTVMSGQPNEESIELARQLRAYEFLIKPFRVIDAVAVIRKFARISTPMRALIVDDSLTTRKIIHKVLGGSIFRFEIEEVSDGESAVARSKFEKFDVVFVDCNMPGLNGFGTFGELVAHDPDLKVVMLSGDGNNERRALECGAAAFLPKPFYPRDVDTVTHDIFGLVSPTLAIWKGGVLNEFDVGITGRTVAVRHKDTGYLYQYVWFRDPPHLRGTHIRTNPVTDCDFAAFREEAERAAILELRNIRLVA